MPSKMYVTVCENKHPVEIYEAGEEIEGNPFCGRCGARVFRQCPNCSDARIPIRVSMGDEGPERMSLNDHCTSCGSRYPWTPNSWRQKMQSLAQSFGEVDTGPSPNGIVLTQQRYDALGTAEYGEEVISYVRDGDRCFKHRLWNPALAMYIHAFEWASISFLKEAADIDIIERERSGQFYSLAGRSPSLLEELLEHVAIDQKTESQIESLNRIERRWIAHHKSGEVQRSEVDAVRSRLGVFVGTLFDDLDEPN